MKRSDDELTFMSPVVPFFTLLHLFFRPLVPSSLLLLSTPLFTLSILFRVHIVLMQLSYGNFMNLTPVPP